MIPILGAVLPLLINVAENIFSGSGKGPSKKDFVMRVVEKLLEKTELPDIFKGVDEKKMLMEILSVVIDNMVPELT